MISVSAPHLAQFSGGRRALFRAQDYNLGLSGLGDDWGDIQVPIAGDMSKETISVHWIDIGWEARVYIHCRLPELLKFECSGHLR